MVRGKNMCLFEKIDSGNKVVSVINYQVDSIVNKQIG